MQNILKKTNFTENQDQETGKGNLEPLCISRPPPHTFQAQGLLDVINIILNQSQIKTSK